MISVDVTHHDAPEGWDAPLAAAPGGTVFQAAPWAAYARAYFGATPHFLTAREDGRRLGQLMLLEMPRGGESLIGRRDLATRLLLPHMKAFSWREGPVIHEPARRREVLGAFLAAVRDLARRRAATGIEESSLPLAEPPDEATLGSFERDGYDRRPRATVRVDLRSPIDDLWKNLKGDVTRTPVRKAERQGVRFVEVAGAADFARYQELVDSWRALQGQSRYPAGKFSRMREAMGPNASFFLALADDGVPVGGAGLWHFAGRAHFFTPVQSAAARERKIYAGDFLLWEMIRWCHARGFEFLDLSWIPLHPVSAKEDGIRRFKTKWGAVVEYPIFVQALRRLQWGAVDHLRRLRRRLAARGEGRAPDEGEE